MSTPRTKRRPKPADVAKPGQRLAEVVAARIEEEIVERGWPIGEILGSETELIERYDVSRAVFREAVRIIEHHGVARMRRGPGGGLIITEPDAGAVQAAVALFEARAALEIAAVSAATERITEEGIARLRETLAAEEEAGAQAMLEAHTHDLHVVIAQLTGNPAMALFIEVLNRLNEEMLLPEVKKRSSLDEDVGAYHHAHVAIVDAIASGDVALAQHRMRRHLDAILEYLR